MVKAFKAIKSYLRHTDLLLLNLAIISSLLGLVAIYSATLSYHSNKYVIVQSAALVLGVFCFVAASLIDLENIARFWKFFFVFNILFQLSLFVLGTAGDTGNRSWIRFGGIGIQPAEFGKIIFICTLACHIDRLKDRINSVKAVAQLTLHFLLTVAAVYIPSKDLGMAVAYVFIFAIMMFSSGLSWKWIGGITAGAVAVSPLVWQFLGDYQRNRILVLFDPAIDPSIYYQTDQSILALGAGQFLGSGYMQGRQTQYNILPAKYTDSIFSVIGEEFGFVGCCVVIVLLGTLVLRLFYNASQCDNRFSLLVCAGIASMFTIQILINIGMCVGVMPVIGLTLPFFSYGGSSLVTMFLSLGIVAGFVLRQRPAWLRSSDE